MAYKRVNWENLPSTNTPVNADNLNKMYEGIANAVEKTGDTLTGELSFNNKNDFGAIRKTRTINGVDYNVNIGVGANQSGRMEFMKAPDNVLSSVEVRSDGVYNGVSGKKLAEQESSRVNITAKTGTLATNNSYKIGNVVGLNAKFSGVSVTAAPTTTVLCTLPSGYYNSSVETSAIAVASSGTHVNCWIRTNGQVVVMPNSNLNNVEIKLITSFIV